MLNLMTLPSKMVFIICDKMSEIAKQLGQRIRQLRGDRHMSQEELAFKAGISAAHLGQIERASKNPTVDTIAKIAQAMELPITALFCNDLLAPAPLDNTIVRIEAHLTSMTEEERKDILRMIRIFRNYRRKDI